MNSVRQRGSTGVAGELVLTIRAPKSFILEPEEALMIPEIHCLLQKCHEFAVGVTIEGHGEEFWEDVRGKLCDELEAFLTSPAAGQEEPPDAEEQDLRDEYFWHVQIQARSMPPFAQWAKQRRKLASHPPAQEAPPVKDDDFTRNGKVEPPPTSPATAAKD